MKRVWLAVAVLLSVAACGEAQAAQVSAEPPVRGLITVEVAASEQTTRRRYPGVLEPTDITSLSFETGGRLQEVELEVGQRVTTGEVLAKLDSEQFQIDIENRQAAVREAEATLVQAQEDLERAQTLLDRGAGTRVTRDNARTDLRTSEARLDQAREDLASAREALEDAVLVQPFDGVINSVEVDSFATVSAGAEIVTVYEDDAFEVSFSVNFATLDSLVVGTPAAVRLADDPSIVLEAVVSELGERADTVSSFPVIVGLRETHPSIRAGMAVEVAFEFSLPAEKGFMIPMTAAIPTGEIDRNAGPRTPSQLTVYVFDPDTSTVAQREVTMAGIRDNQLLVIDGLQPGERIASKGVTFLHDGMRVKLIENPRY
ncbi:MAG: efflux RND transporter periplasmic adaptor subunit [Neomegalonema sp.]